MRSTLLSLVSLLFCGSVAMSAIDTRSEQHIDGEMEVRASLKAPANPGLGIEIIGRWAIFSTIYPSTENDAPWSLRAERKEMVMSKVSGPHKISDIKGLPDINGTINVEVEDGGIELKKKDGTWCVRARINLTLSSATSFDADLDAVCPGQGMGRVHIGKEPVVVHHDDYVAVPSSILHRFTWNDQPYERLGFFLGGEIDRSQDRKMRFTQLLKDKEGRLLLANLTDHGFTDRPCPILQGRKIIDQQLYGGTAYETLPEYLRDLLEHGGWTLPDEGPEKTLGCSFIEDDPESPGQLTLFQVELHRVDRLVTKVICERFPFQVGEDFRSLLKAAQNPK